MNRGRLCLLHSIDDVDHFLEGPGRNGGWELLSTHCSVKDSLQAKGIRCRDISEYITPDDQKELRESSLPGGALHEEARWLLNALDVCFDQEILKPLGLRHHVPIFSCVYGYLLCQALWCKSLFLKAISRVLAQTAPETVAVYVQEQSAPFYTAEELLQDPAADRFGFTLITLCSTGQRASAPIAALPIKPTFSTYARALKKHVRSAFRNIETVHNGLKNGTLLLFDEAHLNDLLTPFLPLEVLLWPPTGLPQVDGVDISGLETVAEVVSAEIAEAMAVGPSLDVPRGYWERMVQDVARNGKLWLATLSYAEVLVRAGKVNAAAWSFSAGSSPQKSLLVWYLMLCGRPVAGIQHGGNFGIQDYGYQQILSDFSFCSVYFSYGFSLEDLPKTLRDNLRCKVVPVGSHKLTVGATKHFSPRTRRVLFPLTNCIGFLNCARMSAAVLATRQRTILLALDSRDDLDVWAKPMHNASPSSLACHHLLQTLKHVKVASGGFLWFLSQMRPQLIVIEYPSSPLYECLSFDVDIFLLLDTDFPFTPEAENLLRKRAHVFETAEEMATVLRDYGKAPLPRLRNMEFYERYLYRANSRERLVNSLAECTDGSGC